MITKEELIQFEQDLAQEYEKGTIHGPIHLSGGNEDDLIEIFQDIREHDWVFSTWRSHYHALLKGIPKEKIWDQCIQGNSITLSFPEYKFFTSAIVGGIIPIAVGVALSIKRKNEENFEKCKILSDYNGIKAEDEIKQMIKTAGSYIYCFIGDMTSQIGDFAEALHYSEDHDLPIKFIIEDNNYSTNSPTDKLWNKSFVYGGKIFGSSKIKKIYSYNRTWPHQSTGKWITTF